MPYKAGKGHGCGGAKPYASYNSETGEKKGCHETLAKAQNHVKALYANVPDAKKGSRMNGWKKVWQLLTGSPEQPVPVLQTRAIDVYDVMSQIRQAINDSEDLEGSYYDYYPSRLLYDEVTNSLYCVVNHRGKLLKADVDFSGGVDNITIGPMTPVKEVHEPITERGKVTVSRQKDGKLRVTMIAATAVLNRVSEIDSMALFDKFIERQEATGFYPAIDIHHLATVAGEEIFDIGQIDTSMRVGVAYVQSGLIDESKELGKRMARSLEQGESTWGCSIEYWPLAKETVEVADGVSVDVYTDGIQTRTTLLPEVEAASWFTQALKSRETGEVEMQISESQKKSLRSLFGSDEEFEKFFGSLNKVNRDTSEMVTRDVKTEPETPAKVETTTTTTETVTEETSREIEVDDELIGLIAAQVVERMAGNDQSEQTIAALTNVAEKLQALTGQVQGMNERQTKIETRLDSLERDEDEVAQEMLRQIPGKIRDRITVKHKPSETALDRSDTRSMADIAANTLDNLGGPNI